MNEAINKIRDRILAVYQKQALVESKTHNANIKLILKGKLVGGVFRPGATKTLEMRMWYGG